jgi:O-antigen ligase
LSVYSYSTSDPYYTQTLGVGNDLSQRVNRSVDWEAAWERIGERPIYGYGLGGFYLDRRETGADEAYPHNLVLELLSETGILGTTIVLLPFLWLFAVYIGGTVWSVRCSAGPPIIFGLVFVTCHAMITRDLRESHQLFAMMAVILAYRAVP